MAVAQMLKVTVLGHNCVLDDVVDRLQAAGVIEIIHADMQEDGLSPLTPDLSHANVVDESVAGAQFVTDFLGRFREADVAFGAFVSEKIHLSTEKYESLCADETYASVRRECTHISDRLGAIERDLARLAQLEHDLEPWRDLRLQISQWRGTEHVTLLTGTVPLSEGPEIRQMLRDACDEVTVAEVGSDTRREAWVVMVHTESLEIARSTLALTEFNEVRFDDLNDYPAEEIANARDRIGDLSAEREGLEKRARVLAEAHYEHMFALVQVLLSECDAIEARNCFSATDRTFVASGWVPGRRKSQLIQTLADVGSDVDFTFEGPGPDDVVPVALDNPAVLRPFEVLTDLYGRPRYGELDPTPLMAGFFFLFFGMCLGDVGYGVVLAAAAWFIKNRLDVAHGVKRFMDLLMLGGVSSAIVGVATRSYFALSVEQLPPFLRYEPILDPLPDLMLLLGLSVALGVLHVSLGVGASAYTALREGRWLDAISEDISVIVFMAAVVAGIAVPSLLAPLLIFGFAELILLKARFLDPFFGAAPWKSLLVAPFRGFLGLYGVVGLGSDLVSYTRLAALGLASLMVGDAMNRLALLAADIPVAGLFAAALILIVGHSFNIVINLLGAFVHPTRLQYVEFFSKFYEGGGRNFNPFAPRQHRLVLHPGVSGEEKGGQGS